METILLFSPLILVGLFFGILGLAVIEAEIDLAKKSKARDAKKNHHMQHIKHIKKKRA